MIRRFIDVDSREIVGAHSGKEALTVGQKARLGGCTEKYFICSHFNSLGAVAA